jgi:hypothetical protein
VNDDPTRWTAAPATGCDIFSENFFGQLVKKQRIRVVLPQRKRRRRTTDPQRLREEQRFFDSTCHKLYRFLADRLR